MVARSLQPCDCDVRQAPCKCRVTDDKTSLEDQLFIIRHNWRREFGKEMLGNIYSVLQPGLEYYINLLLTHKMVYVTHQSNTEQDISCGDIAVNRRIKPKMSRLNTF